MNKYSLTQILIILFVLVGTAQTHSDPSNQRIKTNAVLVIGTHLSSAEDNIIEMNKITISKNKFSLKIFRSTKK